MYKIVRKQTGTWFLMQKRLDFGHQFIPYFLVKLEAN